MSLLSTTDAALKKIELKERRTENWSSPLAGEEKRLDVVFMLCNHQFLRSRLKLSFQTLAVQANKLRDLHCSACWCLTLFLAEAVR